MCVPPVVIVIIIVVIIIIVIIIIVIIIVIVKAPADQSDNKPTNGPQLMDRDSNEDN